MRGKILQRYVLWELTSPTLLGLVVFTFVLLATHLFRLMDLLVNRGVPLPLFAALVGTLLPPLLVLTTPMALLVGVLLGVGRLSADNEVMAMRTSGVNLLTIFYPVMMAGGLMTAVLWQANGNWVPTLVGVNKHLIDDIKYIVASRIEPGRRFEPQSSRDVALYFRHRNPLTQRMEEITLKVGASDAKQPQGQAKKSQMLITAREGHIDADPFRKCMDVILSSGTLHQFDNESTGPDFRHIVATFSSMQCRLDLSTGDLRSSEAATLRNADIVAAIADGMVWGKEKGELYAELQQRRSIPLACLAFVLLGVPLAIRVRPTGKAVAFAIAFGLIFFYYIMLKWGASLSQEGSAFGSIIIFLPNILVGGIGVLLFIRTLRR